MRDVDPFFVAANLVEAGLWCVLGVGCAIAAAVLPAAARRRCLLAAVAFVAFGGSDVVEAHTGAWWKPWWLLAWKAACVAALVGLLVVHVRRRRLTSPKHRGDGDAGSAPSA